MGSVKSQTWAIRFTHPEDAEMKFEELFKDNYIWLAYVKETGKTDENPHYHVLINLKVVLTRNGFIKQIRKWFPHAGNAHFSMKVWDGNDRAFQYLHKENVPLTFGTRLQLRTTDEYVENARAEPKAFMRKQKQSYDELLANCVAEWNTQQLSKVYEFREYEIIKFAVSQLYLEKMREMGLPPKNLFAMRGDCTKILFEINSKVTNEALANSIAKGI